MSATIYDAALLKKLNSWTERAKLQVFGPSDARTRLAVLADLNDDKTIKLPFIVLSRPNGYTINNTLKTPITYNGKAYKQKEETNKIITVNAIPITLNYQLDVYTRYEQEADALMRELVFNFINYPAVRIVIPYLDTGLVHESTVRFASEAVEIDKSSLSIKSDQVFNYGIELKIDDAYLWDVRAKDAVDISVNDLTVSTKINTIVTKEQVDGGGIWTEEEELEVL